MKCPQCGNNQKYADGMTCGSCGYRFALNPKQAPNISDMAFKKAADRLSMNSHYYYTYNQLYAHVYRLLRKKKRTARIVGTVVFLVFAVILFFTLIREFGWAVSGIYLSAIAAFTAWILRRPMTVSHQLVAQVIQTYRSNHKLDRLAGGDAFRGRAPDVDPEIFQYAPERILIVDRDDLADMLILNRFHFENKTLVLSANKYPTHIFDACRRFLENFPHIPVHLIHDASRNGHKLKNRILTDKSWNLKGAAVTDLGLFPQDLKAVRAPVWMPDEQADRVEKVTHPAKEKPVDMIMKGYKMPSDLGAPRATMGAFMLAMSTGAALLSDAFLGHRQSHAGGGSDFGGGFG